MPWFAEEGITFNQKEDVVGHIYRLSKRGEGTAMAAFAVFALNMLKRVGSTALVEAQFSLVSIMKSESRSDLDLDSLRCMLYLASERDFKDTELDFVELWQAMRR